MRLWHYKLLRFLPKSQLLAQWRELNSIYVKQDKHILINYIYEYDKNELFIYSLLVLYEFEKRGIKVKSYDNINKYFNYDVETFYNAHTWTLPDYLFERHHNQRYLLQCYYNLEEKYDRGQKDFSQKEYEELRKFIALEVLR